MKLQKSDGDISLDEHYFIRITQLIYFYLVFRKRKGLQRSVSFEGF